jgi:purine-binding chemotaxis protein CheW
MNKSFITIKIDEYLFGIDVSFVREVNRYIDISPVSLAPDFIVGLMNLRGQIITIIDPAVRLELGKTEIKQSSRCVVMKSGAELSHTKANISYNETVGILVDAVGDIVLVDEEAIEPLPPNLTEIDNEHISGVIKLEKDLLLILKIDVLLTNDLKKSPKHPVLKEEVK